MLLVYLILMLQIVTRGLGFRLPVQSFHNFYRRRLISSSLSSTLGSLIQRDGSTSKTSFTFVGGKGGVGKTSTSSAIAIALSDQGFKTLIVSTDPAHSLGDALDTNLSSGKVVPIVSEQNLWAMELSVDEAMGKFRNAVAGLDSASLSRSLGVPKELIDSFGLDDLTSIFTNPPPGIDEIVALTEIFAYADVKDAVTGRPRFDRIVIDTAPTGHTLKLLQLPDFLNSVVGRLIKFRAKLQGAIDTFKNMFGGGGAAGVGAGGGISDALSRLEELQEKMSSMKRSLTNQDETQFVVVTIATSLAVAESRRLVASLRTEGINLRGIVCNQIVADNASGAYIKTRRSGQQSCISSLTQSALATQPSIEITTVPYVDTEVTGIYGLRYFAQLAHKPIPKTATNPIDSRKLTIFGGKGGVGKTTTAASWAVRLSDSGIKTLVVSTDPAHSLGDAFKEPLTGLPRKLDEALDGSGGELWAMEIDPVAAMSEFRDTLREALGPQAGKGSGAGSFASGMGLPDLKGELAAMLSGDGEGDSSLFSAPGADEVIAMLKVVTYLEDGFARPDGSVVKFDRVVLDTAPTGHTLRMLQLPVFLQDLVSKMKRVRDKAGGMGMGMGMDVDDAMQSEDRLDKFEKRMRRLELLLHNPKESEFAVVTIPTELATAESRRLLGALDQESVAVRRLIINQVIPQQDADASSDAFLGRLRAGQKSSLAELQAVAESAKVELIQVPYFDTEVRTVYGLRLIGMHLFPPAK